MDKRPKRTKREVSKSLTATGEFLERNANRDPRLGIVLRIANLLSAQVTLDELIALIMSGCTELLNADRSTLFLLSDDGQYLWSKYAQGNEVHEIRMRVGEGIAGWVAQTGRPVNIKDVYKDHRFDKEWDLRNDYRTRSMLCQPVRNRAGDVIGVAQVLNKSTGYFTVDDAIMLRTIMAMAAISLVNARLYNALLARNMELVQAQRDLQARMREIDLLYVIERDASSAADVDEAIGILLRRLQQTVPCELVQVALTAEDGSIIAHRLHARGAEVERVRFEQPTGFIGIVLRRTSELALDSMVDVEILQAAQAEHMDPPGNGLCIRLEDDQRSLGVMSFYGRGSGPQIADLDRKLMALVASRAARFIARRLALTQAERENRMAALGGAIATILHDFKTPMTVASGYAQMMVRTEDKARRKEMAQTVVKQLDRVNQMSREVLSFARGHTELLLQKVHINDFVTEAEELLGQVFAKSGVAYAIEANFKGAARIDRLKLLRVVQNMSRNAREAMTMVERPEGHRFHFVIDHEDGELVFIFSDTGTGVAPEFRHRMFEAFETHGKKDGTGLGLAMVKRFAESHGGSVEYRDTPGGGATFEVRIRRGTGPDTNEQDQVDPKHARKPAAAAPKPAPERIGAESDIPPALPAAAVKH